MRRGGYKSVGFGCLVVLLLGHPGLSSAAPSEFEMNGIVMVPGGKRVLIKTHDATGSEINFMLAEGQSRNGIKLLSVDTKNNLAEFDNHGTLQVLKICPTPELTVAFSSSPNQHFASAPSPSSAATGKMAPRTSTSENPPNEPIGAVHPGYVAGATGGGSASTISGGAPPAATTGANPANGATAGTSSAPDSSSAEKATWWYTGSQEIEQARLETEDAVRQGVLPPYPLTPLTPTGTPPELIGPEQAFFNHFTRHYRPN